MGELFHISDVVQKYISGDWGEEANDGTLVEVACVRGADIVDVNDSKFDNIPVRYITSASVAQRGLNVGDIVIEKSGGAPTQSTGRVAFISEACKKAHANVVCSNFCAAFTVKPDWNARYIFYYLQFFYKTGVFFNFEGKTSGLHNLDIEHAFGAIPIKRVSLEEQDRIAAVLTSIDEKMALNRKINAKLVSVARKIYDYWFIQFDFPYGTKAYKSSGGAMEYDALLKREIPKGWEVKAINDISSSTRGVTYSKDDLVEKSGSSRLVLRGNNIENNVLIYDNNVAYVPDSLVSDEQRIRKYDIVMTMSSGSKAHIGKSIFFNYDSQDTYGAFLNKFTSPREYAYLLFLYFISDEFKLKIQSICNGTGINNLTYESFNQVYIPVPDKLTLDSFVSVVSPLFDTIGQNELENFSLSSQRDKLLPLLMNGQVIVD